MIPKRYLLLPAVILTLIVLAACAGPATAPPTGGSCSLNLATSSSDQEAIQAVVDAEGQLVVAQQIDALMALWADGSYIADAKHTPDQQQDDRFWRDKDAIRHRYVRTVFPGAPQQAVPADLDIKIDGARAQVLATTNIGAERSPAGDQWMLVKVGGCWLIESLTYNLEAQP